MRAHRWAAALVAVAALLAVAIRTRPTPPSLAPGTTPSEMAPVDPELTAFANECLRPTIQEPDRRQTDPAQELHDLLSKADALSGKRRDEARATARLQCDQGSPSLRALAIHLLIELGPESADRHRFEAWAHDPDLRVSLAARRGLFEYWKSLGEETRAQEILASMKETP